MNIGFVDIYSSTCPAVVLGRSEPLLLDLGSQFALPFREWHHGMESNQWGDCVTRNSGSHEVTPTHSKIFEILTKEFNNIHRVERDNLDALFKSFSYILQVHGS